MIILSNLSYTQRKPVYQYVKDATHRRIIFAKLPNGPFGSEGQSGKALDAEATFENFNHKGL